jgi:hypothetical protein
VEGALRPKQDRGPARETADARATFVGIRAYTAMQLLARLREAIAAAARQHAF